MTKEYTTVLSNGTNVHNEYPDTIQTGLSPQSCHIDIDIEVAKKLVNKIQ